MTSAYASFPRVWPGGAWGGQRVAESDRDAIAESRLRMPRGSLTLLQRSRMRRPTEAAFEGRTSGGGDGDCASHVSDHAHRRPKT